MREGAGGAVVTEPLPPPVERGPLLGTIGTIYDRLLQPVWMSHGVRGDFVDYRGKERFTGRGNWRFTVFDSGALPYFEHPQEFGKSMLEFLDAPPVV